MLVGEISAELFFIKQALRDISQVPDHQITLFVVLFALRAQSAPSGSN